MAATKHQFLVLDGLRGIAAISVMLFHRRSWFGDGRWLEHAYLAVDFFFMLSAFVLAYAYQNRLQGPGQVRAFMRDRLIRLHPMLAFGAILALVVAAASDRAGAGSMGPYSWATFFASFVPIPAWWASSPEAFPWNLPLWSLFWELIASLFFVLLIVRLRSVTLLVLGLVMWVPATFASYSFEGLRFGFQTEPAHLALGFFRVIPAFLIGTFLLRIHQRLDIRQHSFGVVGAALMVASFNAIPDHIIKSWIYDIIVVTLLYPAIILFSASAKPIFPKITVLMGAISYPLYIIHEPLLKLIAGVYRKAEIASAAAGQIPSFPDALSRFVLVAALAWLALKLYDEPVRGLLSKLKDKQRKRLPAAYPNLY